MSWGLGGPASPEPVFVDQVRRAYANLKAILASSGASLDDVVDMMTFHTDPEARWETVMTMKADEIGLAPYPNWTAVVVTGLAGFEFEIMVIARIPETSRSAS